MNMNELIAVILTFVQYLITQENDDDNNTNILLHTTILSVLWQFFLLTCFLICEKVLLKTNKSELKVLFGDV